MYADNRCAPRPCYMFGLTFLISIAGAMLFSSLVAGFDDKASSPAQPKFMLLWSEHVEQSNCETYACLAQAVAEALYETFKLTLYGALKGLPVALYGGFVLGVGAELVARCIDLLVGDMRPHID